MLKILYIILFVVFVISVVFATRYIVKRQKRLSKVAKVVRKEIAIRKYVEQNFSSYEDQYRILKDTITFWSSTYNSISASIYLNDWELDRLIIFNKERDKLIGFLSVVDTVSKDRYFDKYYFLRGIKDGQKWLFHLGHQTMLSRGTHKVDAFHPLSFNETRVLAHYYGSSFVKERNGVLVIDYERVEDLFSRIKLGGQFGQTAIETFKYFNHKRASIGVDFTLDEIVKIRKESTRPEEPPMTEQRNRSIEFWTRVFSELDVLD